ncbi:MAG: bifunctional adenosylcobinamide kinase/adenosylcobinamide-phosphate guanylyltransferase [Nitrospirota bacterium]
MNRLIFITGGARCGKSGFAVTSAEKTGGTLTYIATASPGDPEMAARIERHKMLRGDCWKTVEEQLDLPRVFSEIPAGGTVVVDCLTLWLTNLIMASGDDFEGVSRDKAQWLAEALKGYDGTVFVVSNEVGMGIVPGNEMARIFRDAAGTVNRIIAGAADEAYLVVAGLPVKLK